MSGTLPFPGVSFSFHHSCDASIHTHKPETNVEKKKKEIKQKTRRNREEAKSSELDPKLNQSNPITNIMHREMSA